MRSFILWNDLKCEYGNGSWALIDGTVTLRTAHGKRSAPVDSLSPEALARMLMVEMAQDRGCGNGCCTV
jgi:hypothetical protein